MKRSIWVGVVAAAVGGVVALALTLPALADDANAGQRCRALRHGADEIAVCLYRDGPDFDDLPSLAPDGAIALLDAYLVAPGDGVCVKPAAGGKPFVQCYFSRDIFEADEGNPAWSTMLESDIVRAVLYSPDELTPLESSEPTPQASAETILVGPEPLPGLPESTLAPSPAPIDVAPMSLPQPSQLPSPAPSAPPTPLEAGAAPAPDFAQATPLAPYPPAE